MNDLELIANKFNCDKGSINNGHRYTDIYFDYWKDIRYSKLNILEIGLWKGASLRTLKEFFPNSSIYGIDIKDCVPNGKGEPINDLCDDNRIKTFCCDQIDKNKLYELFKNLSFDIILDDGGHNIIYQQKTFGYLFKFVKSKGMYIIEDIHTSLMGEEWGLSPDNEYTTLSVLKKAQKTKKIITPYIDNEDIEYINNNIYTIDIFDTKTTIPVPLSLQCNYKCDLTSIIRKI